MLFKLETTLRGATDQELLNELIRVASLINSETVKRKDFQNYGKCSPSVIERRFGTWNEGLKRAGLSLSIQKIITDDELFLNIEKMWSALGRQPRYSEVKRPFSKFSNVTYASRFGSFSVALEQFVEWVNSTDKSLQQYQNSLLPDAVDPTLQLVTAVRRTHREISDRQRFRILCRDGFRCKSCGASPMKELGVELHVDHILPWSKGGETVDDNLECKCKQCNLGKGNAFNV